MTAGIACTACAPKDYVCLNPFGHSESLGFKRAAKKAKEAEALVKQMEQKSEALAKKMEEKSKALQAQIDDAKSQIDDAKADQAEKLKKLEQELVEKNKMEKALSEEVSLLKKLAESSPKNSSSLINKEETQTAPDSCVDKTLTAFMTRMDTVTEQIKNVSLATQDLKSAFDMQQMKKQIKIDERKKADEIIEKYKLKNPPNPPQIVPTPQMSAFQMVPQLSSMLPIPQLIPQVSQFMPQMSQPQSEFQVVPLPWVSKFLQSFTGR